MNKQEIMEILPHRDNMLLVEEAEVVEVEDKNGEMKKMSHGKYHVRGDEFFLQGHFPGNPIVPGVILCEMMAQSTCVLLQDAMEEGMSSLFTGLKEVKFKNPVKPGDTFESKCEIISSKPPFYFAKGQGYVDGKLAVKAEFSFALIKTK
ncbi:MAG: beta-hydroxyacyl-ACP dehydratase [Firmicutes bacterium]|nr:beta-hydroxyacyl-ACP dehydratase [Bacillota bacterium]